MMNVLVAILLVALSCACVQSEGKSCGFSSCKGTDKCCPDYVCRQSCKGLTCSDKYDCASGDSCCNGYCKKGAFCTCLSSDECGDGRRCCDHECKKGNCSCSSNDECGPGKSCCGSKCRAGNSSCVGYSCSDTSDCQSDESCCDGSCKAGSFCSCSSNFDCATGESCCGSRCKSGSFSCLGHSCSYSSDCQSDETCSGGTCSNKRTYLAIVLSIVVLVIFGIPLVMAVAGKYFSAGPCARRLHVTRQPPPAATLVTTSNVVQGGGPAYSQPAAPQLGHILYPPVQTGPPPGYTDHGVANPMAGTAYPTGHANAPGQMHPPGHELYPPVQQGPPSGYTDHGVANLMAGKDVK